MVGMLSADRGYRTDPLDLALLQALHDNPRVGDLELSRLLRVARATVQSRLRRLQEAGIIAGWGPELDVSAAGFGVLAFVNLEIAQGALEAVREELLRTPQVLEAHATTGSSDVLCKIAAASHADLQEVLLSLDRSEWVVRSTSVVALSVLIPPRVLPLLGTTATDREPRAPAFR